MGVTLERVQFKFASIIGELCNEPKILSQFAVWLDMRLAEFKLKGSISLDCSGEPTPPGWIEGLEEVIAAKCSENRKNISQFAEHCIEIADDNDIHIIQTEVQDTCPENSVFPVSLHPSRSMSHLTDSHRVNRRRTNSSASNFTERYHSSPKSSRISTTTPTTESVLHTQSLASIISDSSAQDEVQTSPPDNRLSVQYSVHDTDSSAANERSWADNSALSSSYFQKNSSAVAASSSLGRETTPYLDSLNTEYLKDKPTQRCFSGLELESGGNLRSPSFSSERRGKYASYTAEQRADMARYAILIGVNKASQHFSQVFQRPIRPSTIVSIKQQCLRYLKDNNCSIEDLKELPRCMRYDPGHYSRVESTDMTEGGVTADKIGTQTDSFDHVDQGM